MRTYDDGLIELDPNEPAVWIEPGRSSLRHIPSDLWSVSQLIQSDSDLKSAASLSQYKLREALEVLIQRQGTTRTLDRVLKDALGHLHFRGAVSYSGGQKVQSFMRFESVNQWWAAAITALLEQRLADRVRQCAWKECSVYFLDWPGRRGQPKYYCRSSHSNAQRQQRHRDKKAAKNEAARRRRRQKRASQSLFGDKS